MLPKTPLPDLVSDSYAAYREAAKSDAFLFGDYDGYKAFEDLDKAFILILKLLFIRLFIKKGGFYPSSSLFHSLT